MKTLDEALPEGQIRPLGQVVADTGLPRAAILVKGVSYRAANDSVVRGGHPHKGFVPQTAENPEDHEARIHD